jgi:Leucine-rich repeat (LRR) protein
MLSKLKKLELGSNQISKIDNLNKLKNLQWLSLEDN